MKAATNAYRQLRRRPAFAITAIATLALGLGATIVVFTLADALLLRPLAAVREPARLVQVSSVLFDGRPGQIFPSAIGVLEQQRDLFDGVCGFLAPGATVEVGGIVRAVETHVFTGACFDVLGLKPALGRLLGLDDDRAGAPKVVVLSHDMWVNRLASDPFILGTTIEIEGEAFTVVGVTEAGFTGLRIGFPTGLFYAFSNHAITRPGPSSARSDIQVDVLARLRQDITMATAKVRLDTIWPQLLETTMPPGYRAQQAERYRQRRPVLANAGKGVDVGLRPRFQAPLLALLMVSGLILLVVCVNLANLLLARAAARRHDVLVRAALGASRASLVIDSLVESGVVLGVGLAGALVMSYWTAALLLRIFGATMVNFALDVTPNGRVIAFALFASAVAFLVFAIVPAWSTSRFGAGSLNTTAARAAQGRNLLSKSVMVTQVALTVVLATVGSLFLAALWELKHVSLGMEIDRVIAVQLAAMPGGYQNNFSGATYYRALLEQVRALPGVEASGLSRPAVLSGFSGTVPVGVPGSNQQADAVVAFISDEFLETLQIPLLAGEAFGRQDRPGGTLTVVLSESLARPLFNGRAAIGEVVRIGTDTREPPRQVIGVARDAVLVSPQDRNPRAVYLNYWQTDTAIQLYPTLLVRTAPGIGGGVLPTIERAVRNAGHEYVLAAEPLATIRDSSLAQERLLALLATAFAMLGLMIVAVGVYGLLSVAVAQRTMEIGLRMALGSTPGGISRLFVRQALGLVSVGVLCGVPAAWVITRSAGAMLYGRESAALAPTVAAVAVILGVTIAAVAAPARRASNVDPIQALRRE